MGARSSVAVSPRTRHVSPPGWLARGAEAGGADPEGVLLSSLQPQGRVPGQATVGKELQGPFRALGASLQVCVRSDRSLPACGGRPAPHLRRIMTMLVKEVSGA